jgi:hypothetical protein
VTARAILRDHPPDLDHGAPGGGQGNLHGAFSATPSWSSPDTLERGPGEFGETRRILVQAGDEATGRALVMIMTRRLARYIGEPGLLFDNGGQRGARPERAARALPDPVHLNEDNALAADIGQVDEH